MINEHYKLKILYFVFLTSLLCGFFILALNDWSYNIFWIMFLMFILGTFSGLLFNFLNHKPKIKIINNKINQQPTSEQAIIEKPLRANTPNHTRERISEENNDLKKIDGIGPKIESLLLRNGIDSFKKLSEKTSDDISVILSGAGSKFSFHNPSNWAEQAKLASFGNWDELEEFQHFLNTRKSS